MNNPRQILWAARGLSIAFALFLSLFAMDVFSEYDSVSETIPALIRHLLPAIFIGLITWIAWRKEWLGSLFFAIPAVLYVWLSWGRFHWTTYVVISGSLLLLSLLYWISWQKRKQGIIH